MVVPPDVVAGWLMLRRILLTATMLQAAFDMLGLDMLGALADLTGAPTWIFRARIRAEIVKSPISHHPIIKDIKTGAT